MKKYSYYATGTFRHSGVVETDNIENVEKLAERDIEDTIHADSLNIDIESFSEVNDE